MNILDLENVRMKAAQKCAKRYQAVREKFFQPETATDVGEAWHKINGDAAVSDELRRMIPAQMRQMEVRYGNNSRTR